MTNLEELAGSMHVTSWRFALNTHDYCTRGTEPSTLAYMTRYLSELELQVQDAKKAVAKLAQEVSVS